MDTLLSSPSPDQDQTPEDSAETAPDLSSPKRRLIRAPRAGLSFDEDGNFLSLERKLCGMTFDEPRAEIPPHIVDPQRAFRSSWASRNYSCKTKQVDDESPEDNSPQFISGQSSPQESFIRSLPPCAPDEQVHKYTDVRGMLAGTQRADLTSMSCLCARACLHACVVATQPECGQDQLNTCEGENFKMMSCDSSMSSEEFASCVTSVLERYACMYSAFWSRYLFVVSARDHELSVRVG